jgi:hypothetical protein
MRRFRNSPDSALGANGVVFDRESAMKTREMIDDPLFVFELDVARRADELSQRPELRHMDPLQLWREAEREVLAAGTEGAKRILRGR